MGNTKISWTATRNPDGSITKGKVWNPTTGCTKVSQGCKHCYAERYANRFWMERRFSDVHLFPERLDQPLHWRKPARIFVDSMSDLFHPDVPDEFINSVFRVMWQANYHTFMILTKRPQRMHEYFSKWEPKPITELPNVWLGVSIEDQKTADERIPLLLQTPAAVHFLSVEPMLGPVSLLEYQPFRGLMGGWKGVRGILAGRISWCIAGCESGPGARPMELDWARSLRDQCVSAGIPFFLKQAVIDGKFTKEPDLDGRQWLEFPEAAHA